MENSQQFKIGDKVVISRNIHKTKEDYGDVHYAYMDEYIGMTGTIQSLSCVNSYGDNCWYLDIPVLSHHTFTNENQLSVCEKNLDLI